MTINFTEWDTEEIVECLASRERQYHAALHFDRGIEAAASSLKKMAGEAYALGEDAKASAYRAMASKIEDSDARRQNSAEKHSVSNEIGEFERALRDRGVPPYIDTLGYPLFAAVKKLLAADNRHVVGYLEDGWNLQHPLACRPNLNGCEYNTIIQTITPPVPGRYIVVDEGAEYTLRPVATEESLTDILEELRTMVAVEGGRNELLEMLTA